MGWLANWRQRRVIAGQEQRYLEMRSKIQAKAIAYQEQIFDWYTGIMDPTSGFEDGYYLGGYSGVGREGGYSKGARDDYGLSEMRRVGRDLDWNNPYGKAFGVNLQNHIIGQSGMACDLMRPEDPPDEYAALSEDVWKESIRVARQLVRDFGTRNKWTQLQRECARNVHRDGDFFLREFVDATGETTLRLVDPARVKPDTAGKWPEGIITDPADEQLVIGYLIDGEEVPANQIHHLKVNTDLDVLRGVPTLWSARENCLRGAKILRNMAHVVEVQASIAAVEEQSAPIGAADTGNFLDALADKNTKIDVETQKTVRQRKIHAGSIVTLPYGSRMSFNTSSGMLPGIVAARADVIRTIAAEIVFPEFMLSADASNNNYASILEAGSPATKNFEAQQSMFAEFFSGIIRNVIRNKILFGLLPPVCAALEVKLTGPQVEVRDRLKTAQTKEIEKRNGVLSVQTWTSETGRDYEKEQRNIREHQETMTPGEPLSVEPDPEPDPNQQNQQNRMNQMNMDRPRR